MLIIPKSLGDPTASLAAFRAAVKAQRDEPNEHRQPALSFAERFHDYQGGAYRLELLHDLIDEVRRLGSFGFPLTEFRYSVVLARLLAATGDLKEASNRAQRALNAQRKKQSDFRYHRSLGLVTGVEELTEVWLRRLVASASRGDEH